MGSKDLKDRSSYRIWTRDTVRYVDLDPNMHVNNGAIGAYLEDGRVRFRDEQLRPLCPDMEILRGFVLARCLVEYHASMHFPGEVDIGTTVLRIGSTSYTLGQGLFCGPDCTVTAEVVTVYVDPQTAAPTSLPDAFRVALRDVGRQPA